MREKLAWATAIVAAALIGFWFGRGNPPEPASVVAATSPASMSAPALAPSAITSPATIEIAPTPKPAEPGSETRLSPSDEVRLNDRRKASEDIVANALALGRWSDNDTHALLLASQSLPITEQHALQLRIARAINEDRLKYASPER